MIERRSTTRVSDATPHGGLRGILSALLALVALLAAPRVRAEHVVLTDDLRLLRGTLTGVGPSMVTLHEASGQDVIIPAEQCLGFIDDSPRLVRRRDPGVLVLADGQRFPGRPELRQGQLVWINPLLGSLPIDLDTLRGIALREGVEPPVTEDLDVVLLANGDRVEGVIERLGSDIAVAQGDGVTLVPAERVDAIALVTPERPGRDCRVWLADGTVVDVERPVVEEGLAHLSGFLEGAETRAHGLPIEYVRGARFTRDGFSPLAAIRPAEISGPRERFVVPPPAALDVHAPLDVSSIRLSGPIEVRWYLPDGMQRLSTTAVIPEGLRAWADLELVVLDGDGERMRIALSGEAPRAPIDLELRGGTLVIRLEEAGRGPIGDTVILERPVLGRG